MSDIQNTHPLERLLELRPGVVQRQCSGGLIGASDQFGRTSAPIGLQRVQTMRRWKLFTGTAPS
jgi:hypothetical protein